MSEIKNMEPWAGHSMAEVERFIKKQLRVLNGEFVDLGLPSGRLWASCNLGANAPEEAGLYFMWGDIVGHTAEEGFNFEWGNGWDSTTKKFDPISNYGKSNGAQVTTDIPDDPMYDAARYMLGEGAHLPSLGDCIELNTFCSSTWTTKNSINGRELTGPNGNKIFLPAAGYCVGDSLDGVDSDGYYWQSTLFSAESAGCLYFDDGSVAPADTYGHCCGCSVRPVM